MINVAGRLTGCWRPLRASPSPWLTSVRQFDIIGEGDDVSGHRPVLTAVWVRLDTLFPEARTLSNRRGPMSAPWAIPQRRRRLLAVVNYEIPYADSRRNELHLVDQLVPFRTARTEIARTGACPRSDNYWNTHWT
jgi:hypothetical protein